MADTTYTIETPATVAVIADMDFVSGSDQPAVGDVLQGATSGHTGVVYQIELTSGTWAGGDAAGTIWLTAATGAFAAENINNQTGPVTNALTGSEVGAAWVNKDNVLAEDAAVATCTTTSQSLTKQQCLLVTGWGFAVPRGERWVDMSFEFKRSVNDIASAQDRLIRPVLGGVICGTNKSAGATWAFGGLAWSTPIGGDGSAWGIIMADPVDPNLLNFGIVFGPRVGAIPGGTVVSVDAVRINVLTSSGRLLVDRMNLRAFDPRVRTFARR